MSAALIASIFALLSTIAIGHPILAELRRRKLGKSYTGDEPAEYESKKSTPTMGGVMFMLPIAVIGVAMAVSRDTNMLIPLGAMIVASALASFDDFQTLVGAEKLS